MKKLVDAHGEYIGRSCKGCVFLYPDTPMKCAAGRREKFAARGEVIDDTTIARFCNLYRD